MTHKEISRRRFLKTTGAVTIAASVGAPHILSAATVDPSDAPFVDIKQLVASLGNTIIPTAEGDPGYKTLESYGITDEVLKALPLDQQDCNVFNAAPTDFFNGKSFLDLTEEQRTEFLQMVVDDFPPGAFAGALAAGPGVFVQAVEEAKPNGSGQLIQKLDANTIKTVQNIFRLTRSRVFSVFYQNFPENHVARDANNFPILPPGDLHQIINPNTKQLVTGWDIANFPGPLSWEEEEARRNQWKKIHWHDERLQISAGKLS